MTLIEKVVSLGYTKDEAERYIRSGKVTLAGEICFTPGTKIKKDDLINVKQLKDWVSRGAFKLLKAIEIWNLDFKDKVVLDVGSSTGGFTEVSLDKGASKVFSLDVGTNQLDYKLRVNEKVVVLEKTNLKQISMKLLGENIDIVVCDVSFISLYHVFHSIKSVLKPTSTIMLLIKPQYESELSDVVEGGYVPENKHKDIIDKVIQTGKDANFELIAIEKSPIEGKISKNIEYLSLWKVQNAK